MPQQDDRDDHTRPGPSAGAESKEPGPGTDASPETAGMDGEGKTELNDEDVERVEMMMRKLQAVREAGEGMSVDQRRRMAARAVEDVMKEF